MVEDVVAVLTDSLDPKQYIKRIRQRDTELAKGWVQIVPTLSVETPGGKQKMGCANAKGLLRHRKDSGIAARGGNATVKERAKRAGNDL